MENSETINIRGSINALEVSEAVVLPRTKYKVSSVRTITYLVTADNGKTFTVSTTVKKGYIVVIRIS